MILVLGGIIGTSVLAETSLPGDVLYPIKVHVNESVQGAFHIGAEENAKWEIEKIERRANEKAKLEAEAKLTAETNAEIESRSQASAQKAENNISTLKNR